ncbi:hypothetical protein B0H12DRAFT_294226 [Mycena haematopus]|nr:hypothetical protein B0H12DRAFT_294226 [Mycena haematopus]
MSRVHLGKLGLSDTCLIFPALPSTDIFAMAELMYRCLRLDPNGWATAEELLQDPWLEGADD